MHLYAGADIMLIAMNKGMLALMLAMLVALPMSGCMGGQVAPAKIADEDLESGWVLDNHSGGVSINSMFSAYVNIYCHTYQNGSQKIDDGLMVLAKMSDVWFVNEVDTLNSLIDENLDEFKQTLEKELNCTITINQQNKESAAIDGYNVTLHKYALSGSSKDGSVSGNVVRAAWNCLDNSVVAVLGVSISNYKQGSNAAMAPNPDQWENVNKMVLAIDC